MHPVPSETAMPTPSPVTAQPRARAVRRRRSRTAGVVMVEYAFLLTFFAVPVSLAIFAAGIQLIKVYGNIRNDMLHAYP